MDQPGAHIFLRQVRSGMSKSGPNIQGDRWAEQRMKAHFIRICRLLLNISFNISKEELVTKLAAQSTWLYCNIVMTQSREISKPVVFVFFSYPLREWLSKLSVFIYIDGHLKKLCLDLKHKM